MKVKIKDKEYEMKIVPRELTAVLISLDEPIEDNDHAYMMFNCACPKTEKELEDIKDKVLERINNKFDDFNEYLNSNKYLHEHYKCKK